MQSFVRQLCSVLALAGPLLLGSVPSWSADAEHRIDIGTATEAELAALPGIGESKAKAIVEYRTVDPFKTVEDLTKVKGIGEKTLESLRPSIMVGSGGSKK